MSQTSITGDHKPLINLEAILEKHPFARRDVKAMVRHCLVEIYEPFHRIDVTRQEELTNAVHMIISLDRSRRNSNQKDREART